MDFLDISASSGGARGFVAARRRRRLQLEPAPVLRCALTILAARGAGEMVADAPVWALRVENDGGGATGARVVLFTADAIIHSETGDAGRIGAGELWDLALDGPDAALSNPLRGYVLAQGTDGRWYASTVDGRSASFRTKPDEIGVLSTLGLRPSLGAKPQEAGALRSERATAETRF